MPKAPTREEVPAQKLCRTNPKRRTAAARAFTIAAIALSDYCPSKKKTAKPLGQITAIMIIAMINTINTGIAMIITIIVVIVILIVSVTTHNCC